MACTTLHVRPTTILLATLLSAGGLFPAAAGTVKLERVSYPIKDRGTVELRTIELTDANLTEGEVARMFSPGTPEEGRALLARLDAATMTIGEIAVVAGDQTYTLHDVRATGIKGGKVDRLSAGALDGQGQVREGGTATVKIGTIAVERADFEPVLADLAAQQRPARRMDAARILVSDIDVAAPDQDMPANAPGGNLLRFKIAAIEVNNSRDGSVERSMATMKGMSFEPPPASRVAKSLTLYGYDRIEADSTFSGRYDTQAKTYTLEDLAISMARVGSIKIQGTLGGIDAAALTGDAEAVTRALADAELSHIAVRITNSGYFEKALAVAAAQEHKSPQQMRMSWTAAVEAMAMDPGLGPAMRKLNDAVAAFISDPRSLTVTLDARRPVKFSELGEIRSPDALLDLVDIEATTGP